MFVEKYSISDVLQYEPRKMIGALFLSGDDVLLVSDVAYENYSDSDEDDGEEEDSCRNGVHSVRAQVRKFVKATNSFDTGARNSLSVQETKKLLAARIPPHLFTAREYSDGYGMLRRSPGYSSFISSNSMELCQPVYNGVTQRVVWTSESPTSVTIARGLLGISARPVRRSEVWDCGRAAVSLGTSGLVMSTLVSRNTSGVRAVFDPHDRDKVVLVTRNPSGSIALASEQDIQRYFGTVAPTDPLLLRRVSAALSIPDLTE